MAATILCDASLREAVKSYLLTEIGNMMESIRNSADAVSIKDIDGGVQVEYPIGEVYGYASDYVQNIPYVFKELKKKYGSIAIRGIAYEYETRQEVTYGPFFYCSTIDTDLTVTFKWQECACCGKILEEDTFYNSSQRDFGEGNLLCLCSPTCMLEYALSKEYGELQPNASFDEDDVDDIYDSDDEDRTLKKLLWERISGYSENYKNDFEANKDRIVAIMNKKGIASGKKAVLNKILNAVGADLTTSAAASGGSCAGMVFVITGKVNEFKNRDAFIAYVESQGGKVSGSVSKNTDYLVNNDATSGSSKNKKAIELGIHIITETEFIEKFGQ